MNFWRSAVSVPIVATKNFQKFKIHKKSINFMQKILSLISVPDSVLNASSVSPPHISDLKNIIQMLAVMKSNLLKLAMHTKVSKMLMLDSIMNSKNNLMLIAVVLLKTLATSMTYSTACLDNKDHVVLLEA